VRKRLQQWWRTRRATQWFMPAFVRLDLAILCLNCNLLYGKTREGGCEICGSKLVIGLQRFLDLQRARIRARLHRVEAKRPGAMNTEPSAKVADINDYNLALALTDWRQEPLPAHSTRKAH